VVQSAAGSIIGAQFGYGLKRSGSIDEVADSSCCVGGLVGAGNAEDDIRMTDHSKERSRVFQQRQDSAGKTYVFRK